MDTKPVCKDCGATLAADAPEGLCPACLMKVALGTQAGTAAASQAADPCPLPDPAKLAALFPQLEILELLGRGGMGAVYKARQPALDRFVALKILPQGTGNDPGFAGRFNREARTLARLNHPNIVAVYDFGQAQGLNYFIMEYVDGANLRQIQRAQKLSTREALQIIPQICEALQFAHDEGVVHRDIKPENVLLDKKGRVKIADFGLAKILGLETRDLTLTGAKDVMGTPHYMAPEQVEHPLEVDHRADIYSLGVVFYELLTGELPLGKFAAPSKKVQMDVRLDEIVLHTLEKEPSLRYQNVSEVKTDVETVVKSGGGERSGSTEDPLLKAALPDRFRDGWRQVKGPAIGLVVTGILAWISIPLVLLVAGVVFHKFDRHLGRALFVLASVELVLGGILFVAGLKLKRLEAYALAVFAAVGAILVVPANIIGLPVAIWTLVVLTNREVRAAFAARARGEISSAPVEPPAPGSGALKVVGVILAAIVLFLAIPVGGILLAIAVPSFTRARNLARQQQRVQAEREELRSKLGLDENYKGPDLLKSWLSDENIDPNKVDSDTAPNLQVVIEDLQSDGTSGFRNFNRKVVQGGGPQQQIEFRNSDLVEVLDAFDANGNSIPFNSTHHDGQFHYTLFLLQPTPPGSALMYGTDGIMHNKLNEGPEHGTFSYDFTHWPSGNVATRRVEVHRLPLGAELLEFSTNATSRVRNGRTEVLLDQIVPVDGSVALSYRYRPASEISSPPKR